MLAFVLGTAMTVANMYVNYIHAGVPLNTEDEVRYTAATANANGLACYCCLGILFAFYLITRRTNTGFELPNWFYWGFIVFAGVAIPLTGSRAGVLSGGVATIVLLVNCFTLIGAIEIILLGGVLGVLLVRRGKLGKLELEGTARIGRLPVARSRPDCQVRLSLHVQSNRGRHEWRHLSGANRCLASRTEVLGRHPSSGRRCWMLPKRVDQAGTLGDGCP